MKSYLDLVREALKNAQHRYDLNDQNDQTPTRGPAKVQPACDLNDQNDQTPAWDQATAERLLAEARDAVTTVEVGVRSGRLPDVKAAAARLWLEVAESCARDHALEAARGWDALGLLGRVVAELRRRASEAE